MKLQTKLVFITLIVSLLVTSCGNTSKTLSSSSRSSEVFSLINSHINEKDIHALIQDYAIYPDQRSLIESSLINGMDYSSYQYIEIVDFMEEAKDFDSLAQFYQGLEEDIRESVYSELAEKTLPSIADYYILERDTYPFLDNFLTEVLLDDLADQPYEFMREVSGLFKGTSLGDSADVIIRPVRESLLSEITAELDEYFDNELSILTALKNQAIENVSAFINLGAQKVSSESMELVETDFLDKIMSSIKSKSSDEKKSKKDKNKVDSNWNKMVKWAGEKGASLYTKMDNAITKTFGETTNDNFLSFLEGNVDSFTFKNSYTPSIQTMVKKHLTPSSLQGKISSSFNDFCSAVNEERNAIASSWLTGAQIDSIHYMHPELIDDIIFSVVDVDYDAFKSIEKIQARANTYDADSFITGLGLGSALTTIFAPLGVAYEFGDFVYGIYVSMKSTELVNNNISRFTEKLVRNYSDAYVTPIIEYFNTAENQLTQSQILFKNYFNENF